MIVCKVTARLEPKSRLNDLDGVSFVEVSQINGNLLTAADPIGVHPGDKVMLCIGEAAQGILGRRCSIDAAVIAQL